MKAGGSVHVIAVEVHGGLQAKGVAGPKPAGRHPLRQQAVPEGQALITAQQQLKTVLPRVAGAGHKHRLSRQALPQESELAVAEAGQPLQALAHQGLQPSRRLRALQGQQHPVPLAVGDLDPLGFQLAPQPVDVRVGAGRVDHGQHLDGPPVVNDQIVADATGLVE